MSPSSLEFFFLIYDLTILVLSLEIRSPGDEILSVNDESLVGLSHAEAIAVFKRIKSGDVVLTVVRRGGNK
jgi:C-terminal processing protease CtpA/Prc